MIDLGVISVLIALGGAAFTAGAYVQKRLGKERRLVEAHRHVHRDVVEIRDAINGNSPSRVADCPLCNDGAD